MESGSSDISSILSKIASTKIVVVKRSSNFGGRCQKFLEGALCESFGMKHDGKAFLCTVFRKLFLRAQGTQETTETTRTPCQCHLALASESRHITDDCQRNLSRPFHKFTYHTMAHSPVTGTSYERDSIRRKGLDQDPHALDVVTTNARRWPLQC